MPFVPGVVVQDFIESFGRVGIVVQLRAAFNGAYLQDKVTGTLLCMRPVRYIHVEFSPAAAIQVQPELAVLAEHRCTAGEVGH
ncbi:MAG: hypothetical protein ACK4L8_08545 [Nitrincola lacisaponensis]|uniref:hypothetical protein n=1 Tax=Nitrincola lacisaponensis TaxID=267850 RepID=UPI00391AEDD3